MKKIYFCALLAFFPVLVQAEEIEKLHNRNEALEDYLLELRLNQAADLLAGSGSNQTWKLKLTQLNSLVSDINLYTVNGQIQQRQTAINNSQQLVKELAARYVKKVYGSKTPDRDDLDPFMETFLQIFKGLKLLENRPNRHAVIYPRLQEKMTELDQLAER